MGISDGTVSVDAFIALIAVYVVVAFMCALIIRHCRQQLHRVSHDLRECTDLLIAAHRELKPSGPTELTQRIERYMRRRIQEARSLEVTP